MVITHSVVKNPGEKGLASEWNAEHIFDDENRALREASFVIAASDSRDKERADYVCDGVADEVEINTAIDDLPDTGGGIQLLEGTYDIDSKIIIDKDNVSIIGLGRATVIQSGNDISMIYANNKTGIFISCLKLHGPGAVCASNIGIEFNTVTESIITDCWIENCGSLGLYLVSCEGLTISNCKIYDIITFPIQASSCSKCILIGNSVHGGGSSGIYFFSGENNIIIGNLSYANKQHGIFLFLSNNNLVTNNVVRDNDVNNLALFDGIIVTASDRNIVADNRCMENDRYEINVSNATCDRNLIHGNIAYGVDHVGAINDSGTNTLVVDNVIL